jgi:antitoxin HicB
MALNQSIATGHLTFTAVFEPAEEGGYVVTYPAIPNLATQGETLDEARAMAEDCLRCYVEGLAADGRPLLAGEPPPAPPGVMSLEQLLAELDESRADR